MTSAVLGVELSIGASGTIDFVDRGTMQATLGPLIIESLEEQTVSPVLPIPGIYLKVTGDDRLGIESTGISFNSLQTASDLVTIEARGNIQIAPGLDDGTGTDINLYGYVRVGTGTQAVITTRVVNQDLIIRSGEQDILIEAIGDIAIEAGKYSGAGTDISLTGIVKIGTSTPTIEVIEAGVDLTIKSNDDLILQPVGDVQITSNLYFTGTSPVPLISSSAGLRVSASTIEFQVSTTITTAESTTLTLDPDLELVLKGGGLIDVYANIGFLGGIARSIIFDAAGTIETKNSGLLTLISASGTIQISSNINFPAAKSITTTAGDITFAPANNVAFHPVNEQIYFKGQVKFESATKIETLVGDMELASAGNLIINPYIAFLIKEKAIPATPPTGYGVTWVNTSGEYWFKNDAGTATKLA
jgi:hypothetical protein